MRPTNESLLVDFIRDLETEIRCNAEERAKGRTDLEAYDAKCRADLAKIKAAEKVGFDRYGWPTNLKEPK